MSYSEHKSLISVVVPVYNSSGTLGELYDEINNSIDSTKYQLEVIFVDDHGNNESWIKLEELKAQHPETIKIIRLSKNFGQNSSTLCGIDHAKGEIVITIDDDLEFHPSDIKELINKANENQSDVVYGVFAKAPQKSLRYIGRRILFIFLNKVENGASIGSSFRLIRRNIVDKINHHNQDHLFINQIISWYTSDIDYVNVEYHKRKEGESGYTFGKLMNIGIRLIFYYTSFPLKVIIYFSFLTAFISLIFATYYFIQKVTVGTMVGYSSMIVSLFVGTSIIMLGIGVLAVFVNRIYNSRIKKPNYSIKKIK